MFFKQENKQCFFQELGAVIVVSLRAPISAGAGEPMVVAFRRAVCRMGRLETGSNSLGPRSFLRVYAIVIVIGIGIGIVTVMVIVMVQYG